MNRKSSYNRVIGIVFGLFVLCPVAFSATYYVDINGNDANTGLSIDDAWATLGKVNEIIDRLQPGDTVLFKAGQSWHGQLELIDLNGHRRGPIVFSSYGEGHKPQINGGGQRTYTVMLKNCAHTIFENFRVTNKGPQRGSYRYGIQLISDNKGDIYGTTIRHCEIFDVNGYHQKKAPYRGGGGIMIVNRGKDVKSRLMNTLIEYNHIHDCERNGIWGNYQYGDPGTPGASLSENVVIRKNLLERIPGDGIVPWGMKNSRVEYNICRDFVPLEDTPNNAAAGIWTYHCENTIIQHNQVSDHLCKWDGQGYDTDIDCIGTKIQYNYSHNNIGGFVLICTKGPDRFNRNSIIRYNISINDGFRVDGSLANFAPTFRISGSVTDATIYNNTIYTQKKPASVTKEFVASRNWGAWADGSQFYNNTFYGTESMAFNLGESTNNVFSSNIYYGGTENPLDSNMIVVSPRNMDQTNHKLLQYPSTLSGYAVSDNGGYDFFHNPVTTDKIGAYSGNEDETFYLLNNLVDSEVVVNINKRLTDVVVRIVNLIDDVVVEKTYDVLDVGAYAYDIQDVKGGIYFVILQQGETIQERKFIKLDPDTLPDDVFRP